MLRDSDHDAGLKGVTLLEVVNSNPHKLAVWQGDRITVLLEPKEKAAVPWMETTRLTYLGVSKETGKGLVALVVLSVLGGEEDAWIQKVGTKPVEPDRSKAVDENELKAAQAKSRPKARTA